MTIEVCYTDKRPVRYEAKSRVLVEHVDARCIAPDRRAYTGEVAVFVSNENDWNEYYAEIFRRWDQEFQVEIEAAGKRIGPVKRFHSYAEARAYLERMLGTGRVLADRSE